MPKNTPTLGERLKRDDGGQFFVTDRKGGYYKGATGTLRDFIDPEVTAKQMISEGFKEMKTEIVKWKNELHRDDADKLPTLGEYRTEWAFDTEERRNDWIVTADSTWGEGFSTGTLTESPTRGKALFSGELITRPPNDGRTKRAGYVNMKSVIQRLSFYRTKTLGWENYTHLVFRLRGDGRSYMINLHYEGTFDMQWHDLWRYPLYTRGGPYWETVVIPFSKFFFTNKGYTQDDLCPVPQRHIMSLGITMADNYEGPFSLEIDTIKVLFHPTLKLEDHAYEEYKFPIMNYTNR